jgi:hypothetical protein
MTVAVRAGRCQGGLWCRCRVTAPGDAASPSRDGVHPAGMGFPMPGWNSPGRDGTHRAGTGIHQSRPGQTAVRGMGREEPDGAPAGRPGAPPGAGVARAGRCRPGRALMRSGATALVPVIGRPALPVAVADRTGFANGRGMSWGRGRAATWPVRRPAGGCAAGCGPPGEPPQCDLLMSGAVHVDADRRGRRGERTSPAWGDRGGWPGRGGTPVPVRWRAARYGRGRLTRSGPTVTRIGMRLGVARRPAGAARCRRSRRARPGWPHSRWSWRLPSPPRGEDGSPLVTKEFPACHTSTAESAAG